MTGRPIPKWWAVMRTICLGDLITAAFIFASGITIAAAIILIGG